MRNSPYYIFGLQRSGTNYLETLLRINYYAAKRNTHRKVWKHSLTIPKDYDKTIPSIVIVKNPYTWIESLAWRDRADWHTMQTHFPSDRKHVIGPNNIDVIDAMTCARTFFDTWCTEDRCVIRIEDLIQRPEAITKNIATKLNFGSRGTFRHPLERQVSMSKKYDKTRNDYYTKQMPEHLTATDISVINDTLCEADFERLGYRINKMNKEDNQ